MAGGATHAHGMGGAGLRRRVRDLRCFFFPFFLLARFCLLSTTDFRFPASLYPTCFPTLSSGNTRRGPAAPHFMPFTILFFPSSLWALSLYDAGPLVRRCTVRAWLIVNLVYTQQKRNDKVYLCPGLVDRMYLRMCYRKWLYSALWVWSMSAASVRRWAMLERLCDKEK